MKTPQTKAGQSLADGERDGLTALIVEIEDEMARAVVDRIRARTRTTGAIYPDELARVLDEVEKEKP